MFCTDDRCSFPLHTLVTDLVDSQGGSALLIKILNRLGVYVHHPTHFTAIFSIKKGEIVRSKHSTILMTVLLLCQQIT